ncbi:hypothetical protein [Geobacter sp. DSM 9736]|uniref:hypothetical protein n=1 Tax=Geobacter sp. DSM 9736 TaxID=1277350 RepID=UPI000B61300E|nr:hypothetical protein [Geobacter sp. DSM 9736]SNB46511.1 hypothetical protein SAMN06269301_1978 [Geobacter sp. DSM 9736]
MKNIAVHTNFIFKSVEHKKIINYALVFISIFLSFVCTSSVTFAWDGAVSGRIGVVDVTSGHNYGFRIQLEGNPVICNGQYWAYLLDTDSNYKAYVAALLAAKISNLTVGVNVNTDGSGYCHIGYITVR